MEGQKEQALTRHRAICAASDQSLDFLSLMNILSERLCLPLYSFNHKHCHKTVKTADLGKHCLFLYKAGFRR